MPISFEFKVGVSLGGVASRDALMCAFPGRAMKIDDAACVSAGEGDVGCELSSDDSLRGSLLSTYAAFSVMFCWHASM